MMQMINFMKNITIAGGFWFWLAPTRRALTTGAESVAPHGLASPHWGEIGMPAQFVSPAGEADRREKEFSWGPENPAPLTFGLPSNTWAASPRGISARN
jgi:hypothetical protein